MEKGPGRVSPFFVPMFIADIAAGLVSIRYGAKGPNYATVSACASGAHAIGDAFRSIQIGEADVMIAGGTEASVTPMTMAGFAAMKALSERNDSPETASRPFDATRDGFVLGEGAGDARARGAGARAARAARRSSPRSPATARRPTRTTSPRRPRAARARCGPCGRRCGAPAPTPDEVDYVNAHGTSTPANDTNETARDQDAFSASSAHDIIVGSTKSMTGHTLGAAGGVEAVITALVCQRRA